MVAAGLLGRIRLYRADPPVAPRSVPALALAEGPELEDGDLEQVVGGLERIYIPGAAES
jgi:hypothetical protein